MSAKLPSGPAIRALLWEDWRRSRVALLSILLVGIALSLTGLVVTVFLGNATAPDEEFYVLAAWPAFFFGMWLVFSLSDPKDVTPRIPARHYTLPLAPRKVALVHLLFRLVSIGVLTGVLVGLIQLAFLSFAPRDLLGAAAIAMAGFLVVQCLAWTIGNLGGLAFMGSLVASPIILDVVHAGTKLQNVLDVAESHGIPKPASILILLFGIGWIAIEGVRVGRRLSGQELLVSSLGSYSPFFLRTKEMSPLAAQIAYEWQRKGRLMPALTMGIAGLGVFIFVAFVDYSVPQNRLGALGLSMMMLPVYAAPVAAIVAGVLALLDDYRQRVSGVGAFLFTRAADSGLHSRARLIMSLKSVGVTIGSCLVLMGIGAIIVAIVRPESLSELYLQVAPFSFWGIAMMVAGYVLVVWTLYWMAIPGAILWFWLVLVAMFFQAFPPHPFVVPAIMIWPPSLAMIAATFLVVRRNAQTKMLFPWAIVFALCTAVAAWCVIAWLGVAGSVWSSTVTHFGLLTVIAAVFALSLCPAFPILAQPMLVERLRRG